MMIRGALLAFVACLSASLFAAPFARWLEVEAVGGQKVRVWAEGDEYAAHFETEDGHAVVFDKVRKAYVYVDKDSDGALVSTGVALGEESSHRDRINRLVRHLRDTSEKHRRTVRERIVREQVDTGLLERWRARKARKTAAKGEVRSASGTVVGVTILVDFPVSSYDSSSYWNQQHADVTATDIDNLLNGENFSKWGNASSVRKYYEDASCGNLDYSNVVLGPIKAPKPRSWYDDPSVDNGTCAQVLLSDVFLQMKSSDKWDSEYLPKLQRASYDGKNILALNVLYAGAYPAVWGSGLWPHKWNLQSGVYSLLPIVIDGDTKHLYTYEMSPVTQSPAIGTICHESGHMVCDFPDFYSYYYGNGCGAGKFSLMAGATDEKNPEYFDPYLRAIAGWITPRTLPPSGTVEVRAELTDVWKWVNPSNQQEYYLIENRQQTGRDVGIPAAGVLIWRCDEGSENYYADPLPAFGDRTDGPQYRLENELSLEQADGLYEIERRESIHGNANDAWFAGNASSGYAASGGTFSDETLPTAKWKDGSNSGLKLSRFSAAGEKMTFMVGDGESGEKPNLTPYTPTGWGAPVVISDDPDDTMGGESFASGSDLYLNWAFLNEGAATESEFWVRLYVDGECEWEWYSEPPLNSGFYLHPTDPYLMNELSKGEHEITIVADDDWEIDESDEDDNVYTIRVIVEGDLGTALDNDELVFTSDGDAEWFAQTAVTSDGVDAAQSGSIGNDGSSSLHTTVAGTGTISFFWNVSSENGWDNLAFFVDGDEIAKIAGSPGWSKYVLEIKTPGEHEIEWRYSKDGSFAAGQDCGWVDQVEWLPTGAEMVEVAFDANGGSDVSPHVYYVGSRYGDLPVPTRTGWSFDGWWTQSSGGQRVSADSIVSASWTTLYAHWTEDSGGGGGGGGEAVEGGRYALCVGLNEYSSSYIPSYNWLHQCVADAESVRNMLVDAGDWGDDGVFKYVNAQGTRSAILAKLADIAAVAEPGDQVVYYHSSHGGSAGGTDVYLCTYDGDLSDTDFANALLNFKPDVKLLIVIDACHSGGMFQAPRAGGSRAAMPEWNFAASVMEKYARAQAATRGSSAPRLSGPDVAWITAADYNEYSYELNDGPGGAFTRAWTQCVIGGAADSEDLAGDGDGKVTAYEAAQYAGRAICNWSAVQCPYESASRAFVLAETESATLGEALGADFAWETDAEDGDYQGGEWYSVGDLDDIGWFGEGAESLDGCAARSGAIIDYEKVSLRTAVSGEGTVSFKWKVSSERNYDWLTFSVDGEEVERISGTDGDWTEFTCVISGDGAHELSWTYAKDMSGSEGEDCGWVDLFRWSGDGPVDPGRPPANDDFLRAERLSDGSGQATADSTHATQQDDDPLDGRTVWWRWTAPGSGTVTFSTAGSDFDTLLGVYTGSDLEDLREVVEPNDDDENADDLTSRLTFEAEAGVEYRILVTGYARAGGSVRLNWEMEGSPLPPVDGDILYKISDSGYAVVTGYVGTATSLVIPETLGGRPVSVIGGSAFKDNRTLTEIVLPETCDSINTWAFKDCENLRKLKVGFHDDTDEDNNYVWAIEDAFEGCRNLTVEMNCDIAIETWNHYAEDPDQSGVAVPAAFVREGYGSPRWFSERGGQGTELTISNGEWQTDTGYAWSYWTEGEEPAEGVTFGSNRSSSFDVPGAGRAILAGVGNLTWDRFDSTDSFGAPCFVDSRIVDAEKDAERNNDEFWCGAMTDMNMMFMQGWLPSEYSKVDDIVDRFAKNGRSDIRWAESPSTFDPTRDDDWYTFHEGEYGYGDEDFYTGMFRWLRDNATSASDILSHVTAGTVDAKFPSTLKTILPDGILHLNVVFDAGNGHPFWGGCAVSHSVLCCGYVCDDGAFGASALKGLFIVDSDNDQYAGNGGATAPNSIAYCPVNWTGSGYSITGVWGETGMIEPQFVALGRKVEEPPEGFYTIRFEPGDGGTGEMSPMQVATGAAVKLPECAFANVDGTRTFAQWKSDAGKTYRDGQEVRDLARAGEVVTLTAQWSCAPFAKVSDALSADEKKDVVLALAAYAYDGYLVATNEDDSVVGVVTVKVDKKGKASASVTRLGVKKLSYKSQIPLSNGGVDLVCTKDPAQMHLKVYAGGIEGNCGPYQVICHKNVAKEKPSAYMALEKKVWAIALKADELFAADTMSGYASLTVTVSKKGKAKVSGMLPDGTKVSASAQAEILSDGGVVIPVVAQLYSGKVGGIGLALQVDGKTGAAELRGAGKWRSLTGSLAWDASQSRCGSVNPNGITRSTDRLVLERQPEKIGGMNVATQFLHAVSNMTFSGKKWVLAKGGKIKLVGSEFVDQAFSSNPGGLTLSYTAKTGAIKGKYAVYVNNFGKSKKLSATINGVIVGSVGSGRGVINKKCSIPVRVEEQKK